MTSSKRSEPTIQSTTEPDAISTSIRIVVVNAEEGLPDGGTVVRNLPIDGVLILDGFYFQYADEEHEPAEAMDHHVQQVMTLPEFPSLGRIGVGIHKNDSDTNCYFNVRHFIVYNNRIQSIERGPEIIRGGDARIPIDRPEGDYVFIHGGFLLACRTDDHHIDEIGIIEPGGKVGVRINDRRDDDIFVFELRYAYVPKHLLLAMGTALGRNDGDAGAYATETIPAGVAVVRGFTMNLRSEGHCIRNLGVRTDNRRINVSCGDQHGHGTYDWLVRWAVLPP